MMNTAFNFTFKFNLRRYSKLEFGECERMNNVDLSSCPVLAGQAGGLLRTSTGTKIG
jgi:hypothetical protein